MRAENPSHACALVLVDELVRCGVTDAVLAPGSRSAALAMALHDEPRIRLHVEVDERSAGFLAIGFARATGRPAPVVVTSGSAVANLHPAVVEADTGHVPLLLLTADRPPELRHTGANQTIDQAGIFGRATRWHADLGVPEDRADSNALWRSSLGRAVAASVGLAGPPGPVHLNLPFREPMVPLADDGRATAAPYRNVLEGRDDQRPWLAVERPVRRLTEARIDTLATRFAAARRGAIVVGSIRAAPDPIVTLAAALGWPLLAEAGSGARRGPNAVTHASQLLADERFARAMTPDLVLRIGRTGLSREVAGLLGPGVPQVLLDPDGEVADPERSVSELLVADIEATCAALAEAVTATSAGGALGRSGGPSSGASGPDDPTYLERWRHADELARDVIDPLLDAAATPSEPRTARDLGAHLPDGATLVVASSMPVRDLDRFLAPRSGLRVLANRGASGIDGFVSTSLGVALAAHRGSGEPPNGPVVALTGDLSLLHDSNGFLLAPEGRAVDLTFVVVDNDGGGIFSFLPQAGFPASFERVFSTPHGRDLAQLARFHRLGYTAVDRADDLTGALDAALAAGGIHLLHVRTDRTANVALHRELTAVVQAAWRASA